MIKRLAAGALTANIAFGVNFTKMNN